MVLDGLGSGPQHHTLPSVLPDRARRGKTQQSENNNNKKRFGEFTKHKALIFSLKSFERIFNRSKESLEGWVHLERNPKISREKKALKPFFFFLVKA